MPAETQTLKQRGHPSTCSMRNLLADCFHFKHLSKGKSSTAQEATFRRETLSKENPFIKIIVKTQSRVHLPGKKMPKNFIRMKFSVSAL